MPRTNEIFGIVKPHNQNVVKYVERKGSSTKNLTVQKNTARVNALEKTVASLEKINLKLTKQFASVLEKMNLIQGLIITRNSKNDSKAQQKSSSDSE
tara:strand:- start:686 stop:976 length:291 start_codon:yes stop_codon:yes gene_type:complete